MKIGILGGGQLGRMLALAGIPFGHQFRFWEPSNDPPASDLGEIFKRDFTDISAVSEFVKGLDCVTYEFENIPTQLATEISKHCSVSPSLEALSISQDRLSEKSLFRELDIACAQFIDVSKKEDFSHSKICEMRFPAILKTRRLGYDGKGQVSIGSATELEIAWDSLNNVSSILEEKLSFEYEVSLLCVRDKSGIEKFYPLVENRHFKGILSESQVPSALVSPSLQKEAESIGSKILKKLNYTGLLTIEFFVVSGKLVANEIAPRVHNSGHWSIEGAVTSQFENHIRAITNKPLGSTELIGRSLMFNLVGDLPKTEELLAIPNCHLHSYRKSGRQRRKIGHLTLKTLDQNVEEQFAAQIRSIIAPYLKF